MWVLLAAFRTAACKDLHRAAKEYELTYRAVGFAALAILTMIPLLIVVAAANPSPDGGLATWVVYGMGLTAYIYAEATVGTSAHGGLVATGVVAVVLGVAFFWWGLRFLVGGRVSYRAASAG